MAAGIAHEESYGNGDRVFFVNRTRSRDECMMALNIHSMCPNREFPLKKFDAGKALLDYDTFSQSTSARSRSGFMVEY